jgi:excisionase family DNA binding protein
MEYSTSSDDAAPERPCPTNDQPAAGRYLTTSEAADFLRVSTKTIERLVKSGRLRSYRIAGSGPRRFRQQDVERILESESTFPVLEQPDEFESFITTKLKG